MSGCVGYLIVGLSSAALTQRPRNTVVLLGRSATLRCQTNITSSSTSAGNDQRPTTLSWKFTDVSGTHQKFVYNVQGLNPKYRARGVTVDVNSATGQYHLVFSSAELQDAGTYTCQDGQGNGDAHAAWMAVLGLFMRVPLVQFLAETKIRALCLSVGYRKYFILCKRRLSYLTHCALQPLG